MTIQFNSKEKKISNHACRVFRESCNNKMGKKDIEAIIKNSKKRYYVTNICLRSGSKCEVVLCPIASYLCVILSGYASINDSKHIIAWRKIDTDGKYHGLHIGTELDFKKMTSSDVTNSIGFIVFDNWLKQQSFLKSIANNIIIKKQ